MIGDKLKRLRLDKNLTQEDMANLLHIKRQSYGGYERNITVPDIGTLKILAEFFNVSLDIILEINIEKHRQNTIIDEEILSLFNKLPYNEKENLKDILVAFVEMLENHKK